MIGTFILGLGLVSFLVSILIGLTLTLIGFVVCQKRKLSSSGIKVWMITVTAAAILMVIVLLLAAPVSSEGGPTAEKYEDMTEAIILWAMVPGFALSVGGIALFIHRSKDNE